jgi:hypothetical protein
MPMAAITADGSLLLAGQKGLVFIRPDGPPADLEFDRFSLLCVYPDGMLGTELSPEPKASRTAWFVPFDGDALRFEKKVAVADAEPGVKRFTREEGLRYPAEPYRLGDEFVCVADSTLHAFDLRSGARKEVRLKEKLHPSYRVTAYDGRTVVCSIYAFDAATGEVLGEPQYPKRPVNVASVFAVRNRIGYYYDDKGGLMASDLTSHDGRAVRLRDAQPVVPQQGSEGLTLWDGEQWWLQPWLTTLPQP